MIDTSNSAALFTASIAPADDLSLPNIGSPGSVGNMNATQIDKAANDFESMFVSQMLEQMFGDSEGDEAFGSAESGDVYKSMMMDAYGKEIARAGGIGIADFVKKELLKLQESGT